MHRFTEPESVRGGLALTPSFLDDLQVPGVHERPQGVLRGPLAHSSLAGEVLHGHPERVAVLIVHRVCYRQVDREDGAAVGTVAEDVAGGFRAHAAGRGIGPNPSGYQKA